MAYRTRSSSAFSLQEFRKFVKSNKAQFFIITAITIVTIIYFMSKWMEPYTIIDTSSVVLNEQPFVLNNIVEKADATVAVSNSLEDLAYNLEEYKKFVSDYTARKSYACRFEYQIIPSNGEVPSGVSFGCIMLQSPDIYLENTHAVKWP